MKIKEQYRRSKKGANEGKGDIEEEKSSK